MSLPHPDLSPTGDGASQPAPSPWPMVRGIAGMAGIILLLLAGVLGLLHVRAATPAREAALGLARERPEFAAALGMPIRRSLAINLFDVLPFIKVEGAYRYVLLVHGPEGWGLADVHLSPFSDPPTRLRFRPGVLSDWQEFPRALTPELPTPRSAAALNHAASLLQQGEPERARELLTELLQAQPRLAPAWYLRAVASRDLGNAPAALADARWALDLDHTDPEVVMLIEQVLPENASPVERIAAWARFLSHSPNSPLALARHAQARAEAGELGGAVKFLEQRCLQGSFEACKSMRELMESEVIPEAVLEPAADFDR
ncbi:MAG TPA: hypothetical protein VK013_10125 [Myxococcaceae bacterium]|nr:hypothetical protein [Myxococcaceae bacterium]